MRLSFATLIFSLTLLSACSEQPSAPQSQPIPEVDVAQPIKTVIDQWDEYTGRFRAVKEVEIVARVSGYLDKVNFKDGQAVNKGDVLFVIDQRPFEIALKSAKSRVSLAKKELERGLDLRKKNSISQEEVDQRLSEFEMAEAAYDNAKLEMEFTEVKSPIDGIVSRDFVNAGNLVNGTATNATLLTTVVSISPIHFYFDAGERDFLKYLRLDQNNQRESSRDVPNPVKIKLQDEDTYTHEGVMDFVDNKMDQSTGTIQGRAILKNEDGFIVPGIFGRIRLLNRENVTVLLIPDKSIGTDQSRKYVNLINQDNQIERRFVTLGELHTRELRIIEQGLEEGDKIVVNGMMRARPGATVSPVEVNISEIYSH
ncbi:efflux RND transporter periplasmic adaptor subunit [Aliiglaciecola sp. 2_MG-2023]|uniref:efflux RND transporter periplasmic adaptor subunit n=1 Tax=Alteromonadaceae TaxID=72275 RepID=UPI0026E2A2F8|nr:MULTISPECIES: efflux RND transporter periplasmic adaptor subunit [unclassified Aliiglaciecola]MDO6712695.1 efflux RND transporter periplasmic adaptor subunit [Aliiglaciecola sp. 2_MG-2023]MDO6752920.1 efflux RND transporter periplasmic adaptor subunit [Aliiglaciecola sp. 1_MG-2023]